MKLVRITNIQRGCVSDGPGVRTVVFLQGCGLRCPWCCNPETFSNKKYWFDERKCLVQKGVESQLCLGCELKGGKRKIVECSFGVCEPIYSFYSSEQLLSEIDKDISLFEHSGGGVTLSGGEPLRETNSFESLVRLFKEHGISVYVETSLFVSEMCSDEVISLVDGWIVDLKLQPEMFLNDEGYLRAVSNHLRNLSNVSYRLVFVDSLAVNTELLLEKLNKLGVKSLELLKCHNLALTKYEKLGLENKDYTANPALFREMAVFLSRNGIFVNKLDL